MQNDNEKNSTKVPPSETKVSDLVPAKFTDRIGDVLSLIQEGMKFVNNVRGMVKDLKEVYRMRQLEQGMSESENSGDTSNVEGAFKSDSSASRGE